MSDVERVKWSVLAGFHAKQKEALQAVKKYKYVLYGGAVGGGKSRFLRWIAVYLLFYWWAKGHSRVVVGLFCEDYPALKDRQLSKISVEFPDWLGKHHADHKDYGNCFILAPEYGEGVIAFRNLDDPSKYQSAEFAAILVDELTKNLRSVFDFLRTRLRWPGIPDTKFVAGTNPGDVGHGWVRQAWNIQDPPIKATDPEQDQFKFVLAVAEDNKALDKSYYASLEGLPPELYEAFVKGNWRIFAGQAFTELTKEKHGFDGDLPKDWPVVCAYDWGYDKPWGVLFAKQDFDGRFWAFHEIYGYGGKPNTGSKETVEQAVDKVKSFLDGQQIRPQIHLAGPDFFAKGAGSGMMLAKAYADVFREKGIYLTEMPTPAGSRLQGKMAFHSRLAGDRPGLMIHRTACPHFWRTIPDLVYDKNNKGDIDSLGEDHLYDCIRHLCRWREWGKPVENDEPQKETSIIDQMRNKGLKMTSGGKL
jgi:phage terminase large subunit